MCVTHRTFIVASIPLAAVRVLSAYPDASRYVRPLDRIGTSYTHALLSQSSSDDCSLCSADRQEHCCVASHVNTGIIPI